MNRLKISRLRAASLSLLTCSASLAWAGGAVSPTAATGGAHSGAERSVREWTHCDGTSDDTGGFARALAAAAHGAFKLVVDCALKTHVGTDIARVMFIDDDTAVRFTGSGKITVDNVFIPAFAIADAKNISLKDWNVEYDASMPVDLNLGGFTQDGRFSSGPNPGGAFNDQIMTRWLAAHRGVTFDQSQGRVTAFWTGPTNVCAIFFISGDSVNISVTGMHVGVPSGAGAERFIPVVFTLNPNVKSGRTVTAKTVYNPQDFAIPQKVNFTNIDLDGVYMGWVGSARDGVFEQIHSRRYGDLQDAAGGKVGGVGKWFAPPHLFYFSYRSTVDPALYNRNLVIKKVVDEGLRVGRARDLGGSDPGSGNALSLKIGCVQCTVDSYQTARPDGFLDLLASEDVTISNVEASYDSSFLNNIYPGWRFPQPPYKHVRFQNIVLKDTAASTLHLPIENAASESNEGLEFTNVRVYINKWAGPGASPVATIAGQTDASALEYRVAADKSRINHAQRGGTEVTLQAVPEALRGSGSPVLTWSSRNAAACTAGGTWSGQLASSGSRSISLAAPGDYEFSIACQGSGAAAQTSVRVVVSP